MFMMFTKIILHKFNRIVFPFGYGKNSTLFINSLDEAFKSASEFGENLKQSHESQAQYLPEGSKKQAELAQSESMVGIVSILKEAYGLIRQIKYESAFYWIMFGYKV